jgi:biopolymer transport protein TolQ
MQGLEFLCVGSIVKAFWLSNLAGQVIVVILFGGSVLAWALMLTKLRELRDAAVTSRRMVNAYRKEGTPVGLFVKRQRFEPSPVYVVYESGCKALGAAVQACGVNPDDLFMGAVSKTDTRLTGRQVDAVRNLVESTAAEQSLLLENNMHWLAISVSAAPLLGLLGTVWGMLESFGMMTEGGSAMLSSVAPGISGALLTTVIGLLVALPSAIGYNLLVDRIRRLVVETDNFVQELMADFERHYLQ